MSKLTKKQKIDRVIQWLTEDHLFAHGGYPYDFEIHAGKLFVAGLDDGKDRCKTKIDVYSMASLPIWYDAAARYLSDEERDEPPWPGFTGAWFGDWSEAFHETKQ